MIKSVVFEDASKTFKAIFKETNRSFSVRFGEIQTVTEHVDVNILYQGDYVAIPKVTEQTLPTAKRFMEQDVTILQIPYFETSNNSGGNTVYIGNEV